MFPLTICTPQFYHTTIDLDFIVLIRSRFLKANIANDSQVLRHYVESLDFQACLDEEVKYVEV